MKIRILSLVLSVIILAACGTPQPNAPSMTTVASPDVSKNPVAKTPMIASVPLRDKVEVGDLVEMLSPEYTRMAEAAAFTDPSIFDILRQAKPMEKAVIQNVIPIQKVGGHGTFAIGDTCEVMRGILNVTAIKNGQALVRFAEFAEFDQRVTPRRSDCPVGALFYVSEEQLDLRQLFKRKLYQHLVLMQQVQGS